LLKSIKIKLERNKREKIKDKKHLRIIFITETFSLSEEKSLIFQTCIPRVWPLLNFQK
jgi:hypothetical protein